MEQHPIPQNISAYQFRLVGDMTLKQFFQLAGGIVVALIIYSIPVLPIVKWPFVILSAVLGVALAFVPLEERPLEKWIFAFFRAIYAPTEYFWQKTITPKKFFQDEGAVTPEAPGTKEYLGATAKETPLSKLDDAEKGFLAALTGIVSGAVNQVTSIGQPAVTPAASAQGSGEPKKEMQIPTQVPVKISQPAAPHLVVEEKVQPVQPNTQVTTSQVAPIIAGEEMISTKQAMFSVDAAPPNPPTTPNVVVGQVVDSDRKIVEGAIMEIRDSAGRPIRALRSNKVGHFVTVTPLDNGRYDIVTDKDGYEFTPVSFEAIGQLIPPILVQGRKTTMVESVPAAATININGLTNRPNTNSNFQ